MYHSDGPNCVWHLDGYHKMVRWRFVIHGAIDGFLRSMVYLTCADNNRATTVLSAFTNAVERFGLPNNYIKCGQTVVDWWRKCRCLEMHD